MSDCNCKNMAGYGADSWGKHHHINCPLYNTEEFPYLFYYEDAVDAWVPAPEKVENLISVKDQLEYGESMELVFMRIDMTDKQIAELPED